MKFTDGMWMTKAGFTVETPAEIYEVKEEDGGLTLYCPYVAVQHRGNTLDGGLLTVRITSTAVNTVSVRLVNHMGARQTMPGFPLHRGNETPETGKADGFWFLRSGDLETRVYPGREYRVEFLHKGKLLTSSGPKGMAHVLDQATGETYAREKLELSVGESIYGLGERFGPFVKNGQSIEMWNADGGTDSEQAYKNIPLKGGAIMSLLVTGFEPFGGEPINPAWEAVKGLPESVGGQEIRRLCLPVTGEGAVNRIRDAVRKEPPLLVLCVGQAGGRFGVTPERVGLNLDDYGIPDNDGAQPVDVPIVPGGPAAYFSTLPVKAMVQAIREAGYPASLSHSAGTYVCNHVLYGLLHFLAQEFPAVRGGFVHVPYAVSQAAEKTNAPSMAIRDMSAALEAALLAALRQTADSPLLFGQTH